MWDVGVLTEQDRQDILKKITSINWKRDLTVKETVTNLANGKGLLLTEGMIELTPGFKQLCDKGLFDPDQQLTNDQVKQVYIKAETKYCDAIKGKVTIPDGARIKGSIVEEICIPAIKKNPNAIIVEPDVSSDTAAIKKAFIKTIKSGFIVKKTSYEARIQDEAAARDNGIQKFDSLEACYDFIDKVRSAEYNIDPIYEAIVSLRYGIGLTD